VVLLVSALWVAQIPSPCDDPLNRNLQRGLAKTRSELHRSGFSPDVESSAGRATRGPCAPTRFDWAGPSS
jgi:hypothetical protein